MESIASRKYGVEVLIVLLLTFGYSALSSILMLLNILMTPHGLRQGKAYLNPSYSRIGWLDASSNLIDALHILSFAALALYLLWRSGDYTKNDWLRYKTPRAVGTSFTQGIGLMLIIAVPGLIWFIIARRLNINVEVIPSSLPSHLWTYPMLILLAFANAAAEETVVVRYLLTRLPFSTLGAVSCSALLRASYHLYQGFGAGLGNALMGIIFAVFWLRWRRTVPLIIAHTLIDCGAFIGYGIIHTHYPWLLQTVGLA